MNHRAGLRVATRLVLILATSLLLSVCSVPSAHAQATTPPSDKQPPSAELRRQWEDYRIAMAQVPLPKKGCFTAAFPNREWREVACVPAPDYPMLPRFGPVPLTVGSGNDILAVAPSGTISSAIGSFENLNNVTSESDERTITTAYVYNGFGEVIQEASPDGGTIVPHSCLPDVQAQNPTCANVK